MSEPKDPVAAEPQVTQTTEEVIDEIIDDEVTGAFTEPEPDPEPSPSVNSNSSKSVDTTGDGADPQPSQGEPTEPEPTPEPPKVKAAQGEPKEPKKDPDPADPKGDGDPQQPTPTPSVEDFLRANGLMPEGMGTPAEDLSNIPDGLGGLTKEQIAAVKQQLDAQGQSQHPQQSQPVPPAPTVPVAPTPPTQPLPPAPTVPTQSTPSPTANVDQALQQQQAEAFRNSQIEALAKGHFALDKETVESLEDEGNEALANLIPQLAAKVFVDAVQSTTVQFAQILPVLMDQYQKEQAYHKNMKMRFFSIGIVADLI